MNRNLILLLFTVLFAPLVAVGAVEPQAHVWQRWETALTSSKDYANPVTDVTLQVTFDGAGGELKTFGFWDEGCTFRIRCAFPRAGRWQWRTSCSDASNAGLHDQHGTVDVALCAGSNPLYQHGFLRVSENKRYLTHADGTRFLWMGDTAWGAPLNAKPADWETYLTNRVQKGFSVVQIAPATRWAGTHDTAGNEPFIGGNLARPNPAYWQGFERKVETANRKGLVILVVGIMEPVDRYPQAADARIIARYIAARLFGNFVIFSPSFDSPYMELGDEVGCALREATHVHLITQHPNTPGAGETSITAEQYFDKDYLNFCGDQSGHCNGNRQRAVANSIKWNRHLYARTPTKPLINLEAMYDAQGKTAWTADDARGLAYRSWLSGALGVTYGAGETERKVPGGSGGLYRWVDDPAKYDHWEKAIDWPSAYQMQYLRAFFAGIAWWKLEPAEGIIQNQPADVVRQRLLAKSADGDLAVAYLPDAGPIALDLSRFPVALHGRWFNPVKNTWTPCAEELSRQAVTLTPPGPGDWVLLLQSAR